jgi:chromosome segregation ATPase
MQHMYSLKPTREVFAEEAAKLLCRSAAAKAAALLTHEPRHDRMNLIASDGLDADAVQAMSGEGLRAAWDIPIRALRNRRINVIESAQTNPFVPKALVAINPRQLTIAVIPFYHGTTPVGVAVLFAPTQRGFPDGMLQAVSQALRVCAVAMVELPPAAAEMPRADDETRAQPTLLRGVATLKAELTRLTRALEEAERQRAAEAAERVTAESFLQAQRERVASLERDLESLRHEQERYAGVEAELEQLKLQLAESRATSEAGRAEIARLQAALSDVQDALRTETAAGKELSGVRDEIQRRLEESLAVNSEREEAIAKLEQRIEELAREAARVPQLEQTAAQREEARRRLEQELGGLREELTQSRATGSETAVTLDTFRRESAEMRTRLADSAAELESAREQLRNLTDNLSGAEEKLRVLDATQESLTTVREQLRAVEAERSLLQEEVRQSRATSENEARELEKTLEEWAQRLTGMESERQRLSAEIERMRSEAGHTVADLTDRLGAVERERKDMLQRMEALSQAQMERDRLQAQVEDLTSEVTKSRTRSQELDGRISQLSDVNSRLIAERRELHARIESLTKGGETLEQEKQAAINAAQQRVTELESALSRMAKALDATRTTGTEELARIRADLVSMAEARDGLQEDLLRARQEVEARQRDLQQAESERERLQQEAERLRTGQEALTVRLEAGTVEIDTLRQAREQSSQRVAALEAELRGLLEARDALTRELNATREDLTTDAAQKLAAMEAARKELESALATERAARSSEVITLKEEVSRVRTDLNAQIEAMIERHQAAEEEVRTECDRLSQALAEKELILQSIEEKLVTEEVAEGPAEDAGVETEAELYLESILAIDRSVGEEQAAAGVGKAGEEAAPRALEEVLILDAPESGETTAQQLTQCGYNTIAISPDGELGPHLRAHPVACAAINLGVTAAWGALRALRTGEVGMAPSLVAYALSPGSTTGFWFGPVDFTLLPVSETVTELLQRMMPKLRRVIAMSADLDVMSDVREELNKGRISTAVVLDGRQALDLVPTVRPEAAVLHLSPTCTDVFRAIAGLRNSEVGREIPILFLLDPQPQPREDAFLSAGVRMLSGRGNLKADELVGALAETLTPYRATGGSR